MVRRVIQIDEEKCNGCGICAIGRYMYVGRMVLFSYANTVIQEKRGNVSEERKQIGKRYVGCS